MTNKNSTPQHISHAHDRFFKMAMSDKRVAREFFDAHLPEEIRQVVELDQLELQPTSYIDDMRQETINDMLFKAQISGHDAYLYLIVDHQSSPDWLMPFRVLKYTVNIIDQHLKDKTNKQLPFIFPLVIYHGEDVWNHSTDINDLVSAPRALVDQYFLKPFSLIDLNQIEDAELKKRAWLGIMELTLKHIFAKDIQPYLADIAGLMKLIGEEGRVFTEAALIYILDRGEIQNKEAFFRVINTTLSTETGEKIMTIAEQLRMEAMEKGLEQGRQEGIEEGLEKGIEKKAIEIAHNLLVANTNIGLIAQVTGLSIEQIEALR
jgi:predicted transposase/invertase (TIGR01784 family)